MFRAMCPPQDIAANRVVSFSRSTIPKEFDSPLGSQLFPPAYATARKKHGSVDHLIGISGLVVVYVTTARIGLSFAIPPGNATAVWPPSGLALAALLIFGRRFWPGVWIGAFIVNALTSVTLWTASVFATGNTLETLIAALLCARFLNIDRPFRNARDGFLLLLIAVCGCSVAATFGSTSLLLGGYIASDQMFLNWSTWWLGDLAGVMLFTPFFLLVRDARWLTRLNTLRIMEALATLTFLAVVSLAIFGGWLPEQIAEVFLYLPLIGLFWLLLRFHPSLVFAGNFLIATIAILGTANHVGAFRTEAVQETLDGLQIFMIGHALTSLVLIGIVNSRRQTEEQRLKMASTLLTSEATMEMARTVQSKLFPVHFPQSPAFQCAGKCLPADKTGGDYFDFITESDGALVMVVADVSGHGFGPALLMAETRAYVRALLMNSLPLSIVLERLNAFLYEDLNAGQFITLFICRLHPQTFTLEYAGAGHDGIVIRSCGRVEQLSSTSIPLGLSDVFVCETPTLVLQPNDTVLVVTDGIAEATSKTGEVFGLHGLLEVVGATRGQPVGKINEAIFEQITKFSSESPHRDDMTVALLRVGN